jgi:hypothetical protein
MSKPRLSKFRLNLTASFERRAPDFNYRIQIKARNARAQSGRFLTRGRCSDRTAKWLLPAGAVAGPTNDLDDTSPNPAKDSTPTFTFADEEDGVLRCLGAAVIMRWNTIPTKLQRELFDNTSSVGDLLQSGALKGRIRFLHKHKDAQQAMG